jgi:hypothetical protein
MPRYEKQVILVTILTYRVVGYGVLTSVPLVLLVSGFVVATLTILWIHLLI